MEFVARGLSGKKVPTSQGQRAGQRDAKKSLEVPHTTGPKGRIVGSSRFLYLLVASFCTFKDSFRWVDIEWVPL